MTDHQQLQSEVDKETLRDAVSTGDCNKDAFQYIRFFPTSQPFALTETGSDFRMLYVAWQEIQFHYDKLRDLNTLLESRQTTLQALPTHPDLIAPDTAVPYKLRFVESLVQLTAKSQQWRKNLGLLDREVFDKSFYLNDSHSVSDGWDVI
ncbi:MAG: hypothetical protein L6R40_002587 [Gallowayella cf. fulva]|nr:MAG: hypothetical protein L6R40_002587 [Xanthomendoza cf. fulva]